MAVESATYISGLDETSPSASDYKYEGDDHMRLLKAVLLNTFPAISGAITSTHTELNLLDGKTAFGTSYSIDVGTAIGEIPQLVNNGGVSSLPAVDGSLLTGITTTSVGITGVNGTRIQKASSALDTVAYVIKTGAYTAVAGDYIAANTTAAAFTITLPLSPVAGTEVFFKDYAGTFVTNNLTIGRNGENIEGTAEDMAADRNNASFGLHYIDSTRGWVLV